ncbi:MAG TPA: hypothetical protein PKC67_02440 [Kiritimatiellia bacterium]|nr:hypothetical protein [Kiritimatiellia bacterium]HMP33184.1 hypothetical protein [Kiritimatiellia bacterium]
MKEAEEIIKALEVAQNQIAASRSMCDADEQELWDTYQAAIDKVRVLQKSCDATAGLLEGLVGLTKAWRKRAATFRTQTKKQLEAAGISDAMRSYAAARYEDSAEEVERVIGLALHPSAAPKSGAVNNAKNTTTRSGSAEG